MADPVNGGSGSQPPKEMSMEVRLLLAFLLMGAVMFVSQYFLKPTTPPPAQKTAQTSDKPAEKPDPAKTDATPPADPPKAAAPAPVPGATAEETLPPLTVETDLYKVTLTSQGATVSNWVLKNFRGNDSKPLDLVNTTSNTPRP